MDKVGGDERTPSCFLIRGVRLETGEILPMLLDATSGQPLHLPNLYSLQRLRKWSPNTIERNLRSIAHLLTHARLRDICIERRVEKGTFFSAGEIAELAASCARPLGHLLSQRGSRQGKPAKALRKSPLRDQRMLELVEKDDDWVAPQTQAVRLIHIAEFLMWLAKRTNLQNLEDPAERSLYVAGRTAMFDEIRAHAPPLSMAGSYVRNPLTHEQEAELLTLVKPTSADNPWSENESKLRNYVLVLWLLLTGMRRDEVLTVRVNKIQWHSGLVDLERDPLNLDDPRPTPARVKTTGRPVPIDELADLTDQYIRTVRNTLRGAEKHPFLFVETRSGRPMSRAAVARVFRDINTALRWKESVTPHVLRHTWNDRFSERAEQLGWTEEQEKTARRLLMGWTENSRMPDRYAKARKMRKAHAASRSMQKLMLSGGEKNGKAPTPS